MSGESKRLNEFTPSELEELKNRLNNLEARLGGLKEASELSTQMAVLESQVRAVKEEVKPMLKGFEKELKIVREGLDASRSLFEGFQGKFDEIVEAANKLSIAKAIQGGFKDLIAYKERFEKKMDARRGEKQTPLERVEPPRERDRTEEPMSVSVDLSKITWKQKGGQVVSHTANWGWAFAFGRDGETVLPETREVVELLNRYGEIEVDGHIVKFGGDRGNLLNKNKKR